MIIEYKSKVDRLTKEKDIEVGKVMVEKIRLEEDLRIATMERKRLTDSERILLNTFDTLKKYYDTKDNQTRDADVNQRAEGDNLMCNKCDFISTSRRILDKHIDEIHKTNSLKCSQCDFVCETQEYLNTHISNIHIIDENVRCRKCNHVAETRKDLSIHIADVHDIDLRQKDTQYKNNRPGRKSAEFCVFWNRGYCKFGDDCFKTHKESPYCLFQERCNRKNTCKFFHENYVNNFLDERSNQQYHS